MAPIGATPIRASTATPAQITPPRTAHIRAHDFSAVVAFIANEARSCEFIGSPHSGRNAAVPNTATNTTSATMYNLSRARF